MKGIKFLIAVMLLGTVFSYNVKMATATTKTETLYVVTDNLNVREKASTKSKKVGSLQLGSKVKVYSKSKSGWSKIDYKKKKAYVFSKYIKKAPKNQFSRIKFFAKQGQAEPTLPLVVKNKVSTLVDVLGKPTYEYGSSLGFFMNYSKKNATFVINDPKNASGQDSYKNLTKKAYIFSIEIDFSKKNNKTYKDLKSALGKPDGVGISDNQSNLVAYYELDKYFVSFVFLKKDESDQTEKLSDNSRLSYYRVTLK